MFCDVIILVGLLLELRNIGRYNGYHYFNDQLRFKRRLRSKHLNQDFCSFQPTLENSFAVAFHLLAIFNRNGIACAIPYVLFIIEIVKGRSGVFTQKYLRFHSTYNAKTAVKYPMVDIRRFVALVMCAIVQATKKNSVLTFRTHMHFTRKWLLSKQYLTVQTVKKV